MGVYDFTFYDLINRNAFCFRAAQAWYEVDDGRSLTFADVKHMVDRLACGLQRTGIGKGDRIAILGKNSLEYFLIFGAAAALGAIVLPINWRLSEDEVAYNLNDCGPKVLFSDKQFHGTLANIKENLPSVQGYYDLALDGDTFPGMDTLTQNGEDFKAEEVSSDDGFVIIHTAAVAGRPRGALLSHSNLLLANLNFDYYLQLTPGDVYLNCIPST